MYQELLATARLAARAGALAVRGRWGREHVIGDKQAFDYVTEADQASEAAVLSLIRQRHPDHAVLAEESAQGWEGLAQEPGITWVVDPLDGTTNFIHGFPHVAVSVGAVRSGIPLAGVVLDVSKGEEFWALEGGGAWLGDARLTASSQRDPARALIATGFPFRDKPRLGPYMDLFKALFLEVSDVRRAGAAALDLAYVAAGRLEGFWELGLKPWDLAAGILLVTEAGGVVTDFGGGQEALWRGDVVAACAGLHGLIQAKCGAVFPEG